MIETLSRWEWDGNGDDWWRHKCHLYADRLQDYLDKAKRESKSNEQIRSVMEGLRKASKGNNDQIGYSHLFILDHNVDSGVIDGVQLTATAKKIIERSIC